MTVVHWRASMSGIRKYASRPGAGHFSHAPSRIRLARVGSLVVGLKYSAWGISHCRIRNTPVTGILAYAAPHALSQSYDCGSVNDKTRSLSFLNVNNRAPRILSPPIIHAMDSRENP